MSSWFLSNRSVALSAPGRSSIMQKITLRVQTTCSSHSFRIAVRSSSEDAFVALYPSGEGVAHITAGIVAGSADTFALPVKELINIEMPTSNTVRAAMDLIDGFIWGIFR